MSVLYVNDKKEGILLWFGATLMLWIDRGEFQNNWLGLKWAWVSQRWKPLILRPISWFSNLDHVFY